MVYSLLDGYVLVTISRVGKISTAISLNSDATIPAFARANVSNIAVMATNALENLPRAHYLPSPTHFLFQTRSSYASSASYQILALRIQYAMRRKNAKNRIMKMMKAKAAKHDAELGLEVEVGAEAGKVARR